MESWYKMITKEDLMVIAESAKLEMKPEDIIEIQDKINSAIDMVTIIGEINLENVEPMFYPNEQIYTFRDDALSLTTDKDALLQNTQDAQDDQFKFPTILKGSE